MEDVDVFLNEEWPALGDSEALEKQLEQCTVRIKKLHPVITVDLFQKQQIIVVTKNKLPEFIEAYFLIYIFKVPLRTDTINSEGFTVSEFRTHHSSKDKYGIQPTKDRQSACITYISIGQALVNDIHTIQPSVNGINEVGLYLKKEAEPPFAVHIKKELDLLNAQWENICKQVCSLYPQSVFMLGVVFSIKHLCCYVLSVQAYAKKSALKGGLDKTMALRKEMQEMQEWINQAEEDYLERDFTYKTPEDLCKAVEELKVYVSVKQKPDLLAKVNK